MCRECCCAWREGERGRGRREKRLLLLTKIESWMLLELARRERELVAMVKEEREVVVAD